MRIGAALLEHGGTLTALSIVEVPEGMPLSEGATRARQARRLLQRVLEFAPPASTMRTVVRIGRRAAEGIVELAAEEEADLIIFGWGGRPGGGAARRRGRLQPDHRRGRARVAVRHRGRQAARRHDVKRILAPVRGGPHAELALRFADALGRAFDADVDVMHVVPPDINPVVRSQAERALAMFVRQSAGEHARPLLVEGPNVAQAILREAETAQLVVMGASTIAGTGADAPLFGVLPETIAQQARTTVIVVKTREQPTRSMFEERAAAGRDAGGRRARRRGRAQRPRPGRSLVRRVELPPLRVRRPEAPGGAQGEAGPDHLGGPADAQRGGHHRADRAGGAEGADGAGPARRRAAGHRLRLDRRDARDRRRRRAPAWSATPDVLPRYGSYKGKGEALWKSLYETTGDLVAWSDTDIQDWHPRFFYGTLGPLLTEPRIGYVKAYYQRPIVEGGQLKEGGGGRVTELVARPLINLFFPELSGYIQPLAGEYAGRREHLEQIPFFTGYAVEIGHLIDLAERLGLNGFGQVDLDIRIHRNQELEGLSRMSFVILQAVMKRLEERRKARLFAELGSTMKLPRSVAEPPVAGGHRAGRRGAAADDPHPGVRRAPRGGTLRADSMSRP